MAVAPESIEAPLTDEEGRVIGMLDSFVTVREGARRWLEVTGAIEDEASGEVRFTGRIPIAEGWTLVRLHGGS